MEAPKQDPTCVLANILAAHFLCSADSSRAMPLLEAAKSHLVQILQLFLIIFLYLRVWITYVLLISLFRNKLARMRKWFLRQ